MVLSRCRFGMLPLWASWIWKFFDAGNAERQREWELPHSQTAIVDGDWTTGKPNSSFTVFRVCRPASADDTLRAHQKLSFESSLSPFLRGLDLLSVYEASQANIVVNLKLGPGGRRCVCSSLQERNTCRIIRKRRVCMVEKNRNTHTQEKNTVTITGVINIRNREAPLKLFGMWHCEDILK